MPAAAVQQNQKFSLVHWFKRVLAVTAVVILLLIVGLFAREAYERVQLARFYEAHPMLGMMDKVPDNPAELMVDILLERVPVGSTRAHAIQVLTGEGMACGPVEVVSHRFTCFVRDREPENLIPRWYIEIRLDENDQVSGGGVRVSR
jgi:hypothetical protein